MAELEAVSTVDPVTVALDRSPSHLLHRALQHALDIYGEEVGDGAVTQRQFAVLAAVSAQEGLTQTDLVRATGIDRSTLADLVARMIAKGLIARERSSTDARANTVSLSDAGRVALAEASPRVAAADARILALLPGKSRDSFLKTLGALSAAAEADERTVESEPSGEPAPGKKSKRDKPPKAEKLAKADRPDKKKKKKPKKS
jgi:DNA-binding MarR family transcriptional regulator